MIGASPRIVRLIAVLSVFGISACVKAGSVKKPKKGDASAMAPAAAIGIIPIAVRALFAARQRAELLWIAGQKAAAAAAVEPRDRVIATDDSCLTEPLGFGCAKPRSKKRKKPIVAIALVDSAVGPTVDTIFFAEGTTSFAHATTAQLDAVARIIGQSEPRVLVVLGYAHASEVNPESLAVGRASLIVEHLLAKVRVESHRFRVRAQVVASPESVEPARARRVDLAFEEASPSSR